MPGFLSVQGRSPGRDRCRKARGLDCNEKTDSPERQVLVNPENELGHGSRDQGLIPFREGIGDFPLMRFIRLLPLGGILHFLSCFPSLVPSGLSWHQMHHGSCRNCSATDIVSDTNIS